MRYVRLVLAAALIAGLLSALPAGATPAEPVHVTVADADAAAGSFELVGHDPLFNRGMNAALAIHDNYAYIGSRTDGKPLSNNLTRGGVMVVNVSNPASPTVVKEIGPPNEGNQGESSRELRVWQSQEILIVLHTNCGLGPQAHNCQPSSVSNLRFYDISGAKAADPQLILTFVPPQNPHEFFLWEDPSNPERALLYVGPASTRMQVYDISPVANGQPPVQKANISTGIPGGLHSLSVSNDGQLAYFAHLTGGFLVADVADFSQGAESPALRLVTPPANRPTWAGPGAHSAMKLWGQDWALLADEVYGTASGGQHGCPWGWVRMIDIADPAKPVVKAEYKLPENQQTFCEPADTHPFTSFSAHNPTLTPNIAFITWHSGGLQAIGLDNPATPTQLAEFKPTPLLYAVNEDPRLSQGQDKVVMWSYPIIKDGLIYVADLRNGLYILRYRGPHENEVKEVTFLEGNSNQGHALCYEPPDPEAIPEYCN
jgi:hypothetical protein